MFSPQVRKLLHWAARILGILMTFFVSLFALDVFAEGYGFWESILAFLVHLFPFTFIAALAVILGWKWPWLGGLLFILFGLVFLIIMRVVNWTAALLLAGVPILIGALFLLDWWISRQPPSPETGAA